MNSDKEPAKIGKKTDGNRGRKLVIALAAVVGIESLLVCTGAIYFLVRMFMELIENMAGAIVIFLITALIAVGLIITTVACSRNKSWTRGAIVTWQILQFAVATSFIQGIVEWQPIGWGLAILSATGLVLVFNRAVTSLMTSTN